MTIAWTVAVVTVIALSAPGYSEAEPARAPKSARERAYVIAPRLDDVESFSEGRAAFRVGDHGKGKWGFIDKSGTVVIAAGFGKVANFHEGLAAVRVGDEPTGQWGFVDEAGQVVVRPQFREAHSFAEGLAAVRVGDDKTGKWGFINKSGSMVIESRWDDAMDFSEGLAAVRLGKWDFDPYQYIDRAGKIVIRTPFRYVRSFHDGLAAVDTDRTSGPIRAGYLNKSGKLVIDGYNDVGDFSEGLAAVYVPDQTPSRGGMADVWNRVLSLLSGGWLGDDDRKYHYTYIDRTNHRIMPNMGLGDAREFHEGMAAARFGPENTARWGYVDRSGKLAISPRFGVDVFRSGPNPFNEGFTYQGAQEFSEGLAAVQVSEHEWNYIEKSGAIAIGGPFDGAKPFHEDMAAVRDPKTGKWGFISRQP